MITIDMARAREIKRNLLRAERAPLLDALDVAYMRALEAGDTAKAAEIATQKQALRDAPAAPEIDAAETTDALKAITLESLL